MNQTKLIKSLKLEQWFLSEAQKSDSATQRFLDAYILNFVLKALPQEKKGKFLDLVIKGDNEDVFLFMQANIPDFETKLQEKLQLKLAEIKSKVIQN